MAFRLYIVPVIGTGATLHDARRPKYFADGTVTADYSFVDYGFQPWGIVGANLSTNDDNLIIGKADVFGLPIDLAPQLNGAQVTSVQNKLEAINVPAGWVNTSLTWIFVVRTVLGMFSFLQRFVGIYAEANGGTQLDLFGAGRSLSTTFGSLPLAIRNALSAAAQSFNLDTSGITGSTTLRQLLKIIADQFAQDQYDFNGVKI